MITAISMRKANKMANYENLSKSELEEKLKELQEFLKKSQRNV